MELAILAMRAMGIRNVDILIWSNNKGVIRAFSKGRCSNIMTNLLIHCSDEVYDEVGISTTLIYIDTVDNLTDPISQGLPLSSQQFSLPIPIPLPLLPFITHVST